MINQQKRIIKNLVKLWNAVPEQRFGQLLENYVFIGGKRGDKTSCCLFFQDDKDTLNLIRRILKQLEVV